MPQRRCLLRTIKDHKKHVLMYLELSHLVDHLLDMEDTEHPDRLQGTSTTSLALLISSSGSPWTSQWFSMRSVICLVQR